MTLLLLYSAPVVQPDVKNSLISFSKVSKYILRHWVNVAKKVWGVLQNYTLFLPSDA